MADLEVHDTWSEASVMRGTGSQSVSTAVFPSPRGRGIHPSEPRLIDRPLFRVPTPVAFYSSAAAVVIGALRSMIRGTVELCGNKISRLDGHAHFDEPRVQQAVTDATAAAGCLSAGLAAMAQRMWAGYVDGPGPGEALRAEWWSNVFYTFDLTSQLASRLYMINTSSVYATTNLVDRAFREVHAVGATFESFQSLRRAAAQVLLGHDADHPLL